MTTRLALITGANRGLGRSAALALARRGVNVVITYRTNRAEADAVVAELERAGARAAALQLDVSKSASFTDFAGTLAQTLKGTFGRERFDFLVNNAGTALYAPFAETTEAQFDEVMNTHLKGVFFLTQKLLPLLEDGGRILNVSSGLARFSYVGSSAYGAMKGAIEVLTRYLAVELGPRRISVNVVAPGAIATDFGGGRVRDTPQLNQAIASQTALGRVGETEDVGPMVAALLSDDARWLNGQRVELSGGIHL